eukprot:385894-Pelagomonas_calceolata.AAC.8
MDQCCMCIACGLEFCCNNSKAERSVIRLVTLLYEPFYISHPQHDSGASTPRSAPQGQQWAPAQRALLLTWCQNEKRCSWECATEAI